MEDFFLVILDMKHFIKGLCGLVVSGCMRVSVSLYVCVHVEKHLNTDSAKMAPSCA